MKKAKLSGIYYKAAPTLLVKQIEDAFLSDIGPGELPSSSKEENVKGLITPFYEYDMSLPCAAWSYKKLAESKTPSVVIIVGQGKEAGIGQEPFETLFGIARVNQQIAKKIIAKGNISHKEKIFEQDEFIESQLPILQYIYKEDLKILPIIVDEKTNYRELAADIKEVFLEEDLSFKVIVPTNFTKHGRNYSYLPFSVDVNKKVYDLDKQAVEIIAKGDPKKYLDFIGEHMLNTDNYLGVVFAMILLKPKHVLLEQYYTTADVNNDFKNFVSFGSIILK